jgi:hypothetical protein
MIRKTQKSDANLKVQNGTEIEIKLILGWARQGKTFKMEEIFAADTRRKVLYTFAHKNRLKICDDIYNRYKQNVIEYTDVLAAIDLKGALWENAEVVYIDEGGLIPFTNHRTIGREWEGKKELVVTADVHQILNSDILYHWIKDALKQGTKDDLEQYNKYAEWDGLTITEDDIKNHHHVHYKVVIEYADYPAPRHNMDMWEKDGDAPFINHLGSKEAIDSRLREAVNQGYQILTGTTKSRDYVIEILHPDWVHNLKKGDKLFCKENEDHVKRDEKRYYNGLYYDVDIVEEFPFMVVLRSEHKAVPISFDNKLELQNHFQPPEVICVAKGQGTDFKDVLFFLTGEDYKFINRHLMYTAVSRARERYNIICDFEKKEDHDQFYLRSKMVKGHNPRRPKNREKELRHYLIKHYFQNKIDQFHSIKEVYQEYVNQMDQAFGMEKKSVKQRQFIEDFNFIFYGHKFPQKPKVNYSVRDTKNFKKTALECLKMFALDLQHKHHSQRRNQLSKLLKNRAFADDKVQIPNSECTTIYIEYAQGVQNNSVMGNIEYKIVDLVKSNPTLFEHQSEKINPNKLLRDLLNQPDIDYTDLRKKTAKIDASKCKSDVIIEFLDEKLGKMQSKHTFFWQFGDQIKRRYPDISFGEAWTLAIHYLYWKSELYPAEPHCFVPELLDRVDKYKSRLMDGLGQNSVNYVVCGGSVSSTGIPVMGKSSSWEWNQELHTEPEVYYTNKVSGRVSPWFSISDNSGEIKYVTRSKETDWADNLHNITMPYAYNIYNTGWAVIDVDGGEQLTDIQQHIISYLTTNYNVHYFPTTDNTGNHKTGGHIWVNVGEYRFRSIRGLTNGVDFLGNAAWQIINIKPNKYPQGFNVFKDLTTKQPVAPETIISFLDEYRKYHQK